MNEKNVSFKAGGGGLGFFGALQIVLIVLKLCKVINWSWWWVLTPIWVELLIVAIFIIIAVIFVKR